MNAKILTLKVKQQKLQSGKAADDSSDSEAEEEEEDDEGPSKPKEEAAKPKKSRKRKAEFDLKGLTRKAVSLCFEYFLSRWCF